MLFSTFQFFVTTLLAAVCARVISVSEGDLPILALIIPVLWLIPNWGVSALMLLGSVTVYGLTLPHQPISLSVGLWILFPLLMVVFSRRSSIGVIATTTLIVITLLMGIMVTQSGEKLGGTGFTTMIQALSIIMGWWALRQWKPTKKHGWWALVLLLPFWIAGLIHAALFSLCVIGIMATMENLVKLKTFRWGKLLCWTIPTVGFTALVLAPNAELPKPVFVVWLCLLGTAWMTDYILRSVENNEEI